MTGLLLVKCSDSATLAETRPDVSLTVSVNQYDDEQLIDFSRFSNYSRLLRSMAYVLHIIKVRRKQSSSSNYLTNDELKEALNILIKQSQRQSSFEYKLLLLLQRLPKRSVLLKFNVYLDNDNIMRDAARLARQF